MKKTLIITTCCIAIFIMTFPVMAQNLTCSSSTTLEDLIGCIYSHAPQADSKGFVIPNSTQMANWRFAVMQMMNGICNPALPGVLKGIMERKTFIDSENNRTYCVLMEVQDANNDGVVDKGWGTFITYHNATRQLNIAAPHIMFDQNTHSEGIGVFKKTDARSFLMGGAHRKANNGKSPCNNAYPESDPTHTLANMLFAATAGLKDYYGQQNWHQVQFHGKAENTCYPAEIVLADGVVGPPTPILERLAKNIGSAHPAWNVVLPSAGYTCLQAQPTIMGRLLNGVSEAAACTTDAASPSGKFVHIEQSANFRKAEDWVPVIKNTFPEMASKKAAANSKAAVSCMRVFRTLPVHPKAI